MRNLIIYGAGAVGRFIAHNPNLFGRGGRVRAIVDDDPAKIGTRIGGVTVTGPDWIEQTAQRTRRRLSVVVAIADPAAKKRVATELERLSVGFPNLVARETWISRGVAMGRGAIIYPQCAVEHETSIGDFVTVGAGCTVGHNVVLGDLATLSPGVHLAGGTFVGRGAFLGIGCCTRQGVEIGPGAVVGGQAMVTRDVAEGATVIGIPAVQAARTPQRGGLRVAVRPDNP